jgi:hypothetical protein
MEALVRLRYARILFEETENDLEAETALSKGVRAPAHSGPLIRQFTDVLDSTD